MYMLDTNILSELIKKRPNPHVLSQLSTKQAHVLFTSCICLMELRFGSALRENSEIFWEKNSEYSCDTKAEAIKSPKTAIIEIYFFI